MATELMSAPVASAPVERRAAAAGSPLERYRLFMEASNMAAACNDAIDTIRYLEAATALLDQHPEIREELP